MNNPSSSSSTHPPLRFIDSFLQEANIKWLLAIGSLILLCSSVMLIGNHWGSYSPFWQYLILFGLSGFIFRAGHWSYHRIALRKTGSGMMTLAALLVPALCFALGWMPIAASAGAPAYWLLLILTGAFALSVCASTLRHWLGSDQTTYLSSYLLLSGGYALLPALPSVWLPAALTLLWLAFVAGTVKINRRAFWLAEQRRAPRACGFLPTALLAAVFLGLFVQHGVALLAPEWFGVACLLAALPVLLSADAAAKVFAARSGGLIERRPLAVMLPTLLGLILCAAGVALACAGLLPGHSPLALTPTALLAAVAFALVGHRSGKTPLVWLALICLLIGYNFSPFYFSQLARSLLDAGASAVAEPRLPIAFYGLSYLPLLALLTVAAARAERAGWTLFASPLRRFSGLLAALLLLPAFTHAKALLPVALTLCAVFVVQTLLFRRRWALSAALLTLVTAAAAVAPFCWASYGYASTPWWNTIASWLLLSSALLLAAGRRLDAYRRGLAGGARLRYLPNASALSLLIALGLPALYVVSELFLGPQRLFALTLVALLGAHSWRWADRRLTVYTQLFGYSALLLTLSGQGVDESLLSLTVSAIAAAQLALASYFYRDDQDASRRRGLYRPLQSGAWLLLTFAALLSLTVYTLPVWCGGAIAAGALWATRRPLARTVALALGNWLLLALGAVLLTAGDAVTFDQLLARYDGLCLTLALAAVLSALLWRYAPRAVRAEQLEQVDVAVGAQRLALVAFAALMLVDSLAATLTPLQAAPAVLLLLVAAGHDLLLACRRRSVARVWRAELIIAAAVAYLLWHGLIVVGGGYSAFVLLGVAALAALLGVAAARSETTAVLREPLQQTALALPAAAAAVCLLRGVAWPGGDTLALLLVAAGYAYHGFHSGARWAQIAALAVFNLTLLRLWPQLSLSDPQFYLVPLGLSILLLRRLLRDQLPLRLHDPLNYLGALTVLVSPLFNLIDGSWLHIFSLMLLSVAVIVLAIGLRVRALIYTGSAFLFADLVAMVIRGGIDHPSLLWLAGLVLGAAVIALAAAAERYRETLLQRLRLTAAALQHWQ